MKDRTKEIMDKQLSITLECIQKRGLEGNIPASIVLANDDDLNMIELLFDSDNSSDRFFQVGLASLLLQSASCSRYGQLKKHLFHNFLARKTISPVLFKTISNPNVVVATFQASITNSNIPDDNKYMVFSIAKEREGKLFSWIKCYSFEDSILKIINEDNTAEIDGWISDFINQFPFDLLEKEDIIKEYITMGRNLYAKEKMQAQGMSILAAGVVN